MQACGFHTAAASPSCPSAAGAQASAHLIAAPFQLPCQLRCLGLARRAAYPRLLLRVVQHLERVLGVAGLLHTQQRGRGRCCLGPGRLLIFLNSSGGVARATNH